MIARFRTVIWMFVLLQGSLEGLAELWKIEQNIIEEITANVTRHDNTTFRMKVQWKGTFIEGTTLDVIITPIESKACGHKPCSAYEIVANDSGEITLPLNPLHFVEHAECSISPGCSYNVEVKTTQKKTSKNITVQLPDCIDGICACKHDNFPPVPDIHATIIEPCLFNVTWSIPITLVPIPHNLTRIVIFGSVKSVKPSNISSYFYSEPCTEIKVDLKPTDLLYKQQQEITGNINYNCKSANHPWQDSRYEIRAKVQDELNCQGSEGKFVLNVPPAKNELHTEDNSQYLSVIVPIGLLVVITIFVANHIYRNFRKAHSTAGNWRFIYRSASSGAVRPISMEDNLLYTNKEILEAQEKGKADVFEIPPNNVSIGHEIGKGAFGRVFRGTATNLFRMPGTNVVAIKQLKKRPTKDEVEEFLGEIQIMKDVGRHENVVALLGCCTLGNSLMMIMEYVGHGDLLQYLRNVRGRHLACSRQLFTAKSPLLNSHENCQFNPLLAPQGKYLELRLSSSSATSEGSYITQPDTNPSTAVRPSVADTTYTMLSQQTNTTMGSTSTSSLDYVLDNKELHNFAIQIAKGMRHLEEKGITHRDLAARNVLIDECKNLKISDFGLSRTGIYVNTRNKKLPLRWLSIEAIRDNFYSSKSDVWAFAIVLWEIGTLGGFPYPTVSNEELLRFLSAGKRLERPEICSESLYNLMLHCWEEDPDKRPSFYEITKWLQPQNQKIYVEFSSLGPDYVFPPTKEELLESKVETN